MTVAITKERREWIITLLDEWLNKTTFLLKDLSSLIGIMMFLAQVLGGLRATIGILIEKKTEMIASSSKQSQTELELPWGTCVTY